MENRIRDKLDAAYGKSEITRKVTELLAGLADTIPDMAERAYYKEALICYKHGSLRAAVVMTWNIAFSHLCNHVLAKRLADFNAQWKQTYPGHHKNQTLTIATFDDFNDHLKEFQVLTICRSAGVISKNMYGIMEVSLRKRNTAAHPNAVIIDSVQADAFISDLIRNVVLQIA